MLESREQGGVFDSWVERWRIYRGIDQWPIVSGEVLDNEFIEGSEGGGYYKLSLEYRVPAAEKNDQVLAVVRLSVDPGSIHSGAQIGDLVELRANPKRPGKAVFADTSQSAGNLRFAVLAIAFFLLIFLFRSCNRFLSDHP